MLHNENLNIREAELPEAPPPAPAVEPPAPTPAEAPPAEAPPAQTPAAPPPAATPSAPPPADEGAAVAPGVVLRESALSFGALWAKQYFGARAENALIEGAVVRVEGNSVVCAWKFPDQDEPGEFPMKLARAALLARLAADARRCAAAPEAQVGRPAARVFDFGLESGKVYVGVVREYLGDEGGTEEPLWRLRHLDGDSEDLDEHELARAYLRLDEHLADLKKGQKRRRELTTLKSDLRTRAKKKRGKRRVDAESDSDGEADDGTFRYTFATPDAPGSRPRDVAAALAADATLGAALAALEASEIPVQDSRTNVTRPGAPAPRGLVLGAVNVRGHGGMRVSGATHERPRLVKLLCDVFRAHAPDPAFRFTTIQINCNYEAALHVDKFNLGPSYIVGVGDYGPPEDAKLPAEFAGRLWVQGRGALDVREQFVLFDGNAPHLSLIHI